MRSKARCHPERDLIARGLCQSCYTRQWRQQNPSKARKYRREYWRKHASEINKRRQAWRGVNSVGAYKRKYQIKNSRLKYEYKLTDADVRQAVREQGGGCILCGSRKKLSVDHSHQTGALRGVLCNKHNLALGLFGDSAELMEKAALYLRTARTVELLRSGAGKRH